MRGLLRAQARLLGLLHARLRGRVELPAGWSALPYGRGARTTGTALLAASLLEAVVLHLLLPWPVVQAAALALTAYSVVLLLGALAEPAVRPHVLGPQVLRLRAPGGLEVTVPLALVTAVGRVRREGDRPALLPDGTLVLPSDGQAELELVLAGEVEVATGRLRGRARRVRFSADDPAGAAEVLRAALAPAGPGGRSGLRQAYPLREPPSSLR